MGDGVEVDYRGKDHSGITLEKRRKGRKGNGQIDVRGGEKREAKKER